MKARRINTIIDWIILVIVTFIGLLCIYPILYIFSVSISQTPAVLANKVVLWPVGFDMSAYRMLMDHPFLLRSYANSIVYVSIGTVYAVFLTILGAYTLSRKRLIGRDFFMLAIVFTMLFNGGLIPYFLVVKDLGMLNSLAAMVIPAAIAVYLLIIMFTSFKSMPDSLEESAMMDGANDLHILLRIAIPLNKPVIATVALFYAVGRWNDYFTGMIFLFDKELFPLQLIIRELTVTMTDIFLKEAAAGSSFVPPPSNKVRSAAIIITILPMVIIFPFVQKYFVKGVMIGAIKG
jgi:putative aldouronate transport system permease protein